MTPSDAPSATTDTRAALAGIKVVYCTDATQARQLLTEMVAPGRVALDLETAPNPPAVKRLAELKRAKATVEGVLKARKKLKAPADEIAALARTDKQLGKAISCAEDAGLDPHRARIRLLQVYAGGDSVLVIDLDKTGAGILDRLDGVDIITHNVQFDLSFLEAAGVAPGELHCTLQATRLALGENATGLEVAAATYLNLKLDKDPQLSNWNTPNLSRQQIAYAALDVVVVWRLAETLIPHLGVQQSAYEIQMAAVPAAMRMQHRGFKLDLAAHARLMTELEKELLVAEQDYRDAYRACGHDEHANEIPATTAEKEALLTALLSSQELQRWLRTPKSGKLSTRRSELLRAHHYPPILALVKLARIDKLLSSFGPTLREQVSPVTGRIHAGSKVAGTASGRASCSKPNLQQIPRTSDISDFRRLFVPEPGRILIDADYASMELRAAAHRARDPAMTAVFERGEDLHLLTAARMTGKDPAKVTDEERRGAKAVNFGMLYGQGPKGLVQSAWANWGLVLTETEAEARQQAFALTFPTFTAWQDTHHQQCEARLEIVIGKDAELGLGRLYPLSRVPAGKSSYTRCCNLPIQGACADASMLALAYVDQRLFDAGIDGGPVAWLHDEIVLEVDLEDADPAAAILQQSMVDGFAETFPGAPLDGLVELRISASWSKPKGR